MSRVVALAGGTAGIGYHILDGLMDAKKFKVVLLSRGPQPKFAEQGIEVRTVDYNSVPSLKAALEGVDTLISAISPTMEYIQQNKNIIQACEEAGVKRFIPSEYCGDVEKYRDPIFIKQMVRDMVASSKLEYTFVCNGLFMDYLLPKGAKRHLKDNHVAFDIPNASAVIPGDGEAKLTYTCGDDVGRAVAALVDQPKWEKYTYVNGDTLTYNQVLHKAENITGKKFEVKYVPLPELEVKVAAATEMLPKIFAEFDVAFAKGEGALDKKHDFGFKFTSVEQLLRQAYGN